ncbi:MAG TPA: hypothetical protein VFQ88_02920 [Nevskiaceae bacterium]|nr:hypothetical protein [Nevskiaceae bacterium]
MGILLIGCLWGLWKAFTLSVTLAFKIIARLFWLIGQAFLLEAKAVLWTSVHVPMAAARVQKWWAHKKPAPKKAR